MVGALIGRTIQSCPSNFENVGAAESAAIRDCFRQRYGTNSNIIFQIRVTSSVCFPFLSFLVKFIDFDQQSTFPGWLWKKTYKTQENIFPNFFSRIATESGLLGPKIALWYFSNSQILHVKKETVFSGQTGWTSFCSKYSQKFS